jgi:hypothetical protein
VGQYSLFELEPTRTLLLLDTITVELRFYCHPAKQDDKAYYAMEHHGMYDHVLRMHMVAQILISAHPEYFRFSVWSFRFSVESSDFHLEF